MPTPITNHTNTGHSVTLISPRCKAYPQPIEAAANILYQTAAKKERCTMQDVKRDIVFHTNYGESGVKTALNCLTNALICVISVKNSDKIGRDY